MKNENDTPSWKIVSWKATKASEPPLTAPIEQPCIDYEWELNFSVIPNGSSTEEEAEDSVSNEKVSECSFISISSSIVAEYGEEQKEEGIDNDDIGNEAAIKNPPLADESLELLNNSEDSLESDRKRQEADLSVRNAQDAINSTVKLEELNLVGNDGIWRPERQGNSPEEPRRLQEEQQIEIIDRGADDHPNSENCEKIIIQPPISGNNEGREGEKIQCKKLVVNNDNYKPSTPTTIDRGVAQNYETGVNASEKNNSIAPIVGIVSKIRNVVEKALVSKFRRLFPFSTDETNSEHESEGRRGDSDDKKDPDHISEEDSSRKEDQAPSASNAFSEQNLENKEQLDWKKEIRSVSKLGILFSCVTLGFILMDRKANAEYRQKRGGIVVIRRDGTAVIG